MRFSEEPLLGHCVHRPLVPDPALLDFASLHLLQVPGFSGRRLVRTVSVFPLPVPPLPPGPGGRRRCLFSLVLVFVVLFGSLSFFFGVWRLVSLPLFPPLCLFSSFFARFPSFPFDSSGLDWSGFSGLSLSFFPPSAVAFFDLLVCALLPLLSPLGVVSGLSGRRLVRISSATLFLLLPPFFNFPLPYFVSRWDLSFSVIFLAADWSGVSHCWLSCPYFPPLNQTRSLAADWSGALLLILYHGTPHKTTSRAGMG